MSRPAFFVDGQTEQRVLQRICPGKPIRVIGCNGHTVALEAIAKRLKTHITLLNNRHYPVVVLIDRETRESSASEIKEQLEAELNKLDLKVEIIVGVCDRMIENWMLGDQKNFLNQIGRKNRLKESEFEGLKGKSVVKKYFPEYHETTDGVNFLASADPKEIYKNSPSFRSFVNALEEIECHWLGGIEE